MPLTSTLLHISDVSLQFPHMRMWPTAASTQGLHSRVGLAEQACSLSYSKVGQKITSSGLAWAGGVAQR